MKRLRVMVTGAGSGVGQGIVKALRASAVPTTIISADIAPLNAALFRADEAVLLPRVEDPSAREAIPALLRRHGVDVLMIGSEFDLDFVSRHKDELERESGALVVASPLSTVEIANDKWLTAEFLRTHGLAHPVSRLPSNVEEACRQAAEIGYPVILKTRTGTSSRHVHLVADESTLRSIFESVPKPMVQQFVGFPGQHLAHEYTCSVFRCADGTLLGPFTARRTLRGGSSWIVEVDKFEHLHPLLLGIGAQLPSMGSLNVQLRDGPSGPAPFELNARFSGTTAVRAHYGFNEPELVLRSYVLGEAVEQPVIGKGVALRYLEEVFVDGVAAGDLAEPLPQGHVRPWF